MAVSRLGARRTVVTANPANVEYILKTNFGNFPKGNPLAEILGELLGHGIFNVDGDLWAAQRKLASHEFTTKSLKEFVVEILEDEVQRRLLPLLQSAANHNQIIDLQVCMDYFCLFIFLPREICFLGEFYFKKIILVLIISIYIYVLIPKIFIFFNLTPSTTQKKKEFYLIFVL